MLNPPHLGERMEDTGWSVIETAARLICERGTLSLLLNGKAGVFTNMALALEDIGWGTAEHWKRVQASYELAHARRGAGSEASVNRSTARMIQCHAQAVNRPEAFPGRDSNHQDVFSLSHPATTSINSSSRPSKK